MNNQLLDRLLPPLAVAVRYRKDRAFARELLASGSFTNAVDIASSVTGTSSTMIRKGAIHTIAAALDSMTFPSQQIRWVYGKSQRLAIWLMTVALQESHELSGATRNTISRIRRWCEGDDNLSQLRADGSSLRDARAEREYQCYLLIQSILFPDKRLLYVAEAARSMESYFGLQTLRDSIVRSALTLANE